METLIERPASAPLPRPAGDRFQPLRLGITGLWQYDYQEWVFEGGWLLLRGDNGAGKSKVLEVALPFVFEGDMRPARLDPFGQGHAKSMYWNLTEGAESRIGYSWLELGRLDPQEGAQFLTIGVGLRAHTSEHNRVTPWFFVTHLRVGEDIHFPGPGQPPLTRDRLKQLLEHRGRLFNRAEDYREEIDQRLFGLGRERYRNLLDLQLRLRQPKLSADLRPSRLAVFLREGLPPIDTERITRVAESFEQLDVHQQRLVELDQARSILERYLRGYRGLVRLQLAEAGRRVRVAGRQFEDGAAKLRGAEDELRQVLERLQGLRDRDHELEAEGEKLASRLDVIQRSDAMRQAQQLDLARQRVDAAKREQKRATAELEDARERASRRGQQLEQADAGVGSAQSAMRDAERRALEAARFAGLDALHQEQVERLGDGGEAVVRQLDSLVRARIQQLEELETEQLKVSEARNQAEAARRRTLDEHGQLDALIGDLRAAERSLESALEELEARFEEWAARLAALVLSDADRQRLWEAAADLSGQDFSTSLHAAAASRQRELADLAANRREVMTRLEAQLADLQLRIGELEQAREIPPPRPPATRRQEWPGAPFYRLVDFEQWLEPAQRAGLEAALEVAGILDAWVTPGGQLLDGGALDTFLLAAEPVERSLRQALRPVEGEGVDAGVVRRLLESVELVSEGGDPHGRQWAGLDGRFGLGLLAGRGQKEVPQHLGAGAREAARQTQLRALRDEAAEGQTQLDQERQQHSRIEAAVRALDEEIAAFPSRSALLRAEQARGRAEDRVADANIRLGRAEQEEKKARDLLAGRWQAFATLARRLHLDPERVDPRERLRAADSYGRQLRDLEVALQAWSVALARQAEARQEQQEASQAEAKWEELARRRQADLEAAQAAWDEQSHLPESLEAMEQMRQASELEERRERLADERKQVRQGIEKTIEEQGGLRDRVETLRSQGEAAAAQRDAAAEAMGALVREGAAELAIGEAVAADGQWTVTRALAYARELIKRPGPSLPEQVEPRQLEKADNEHTSAFLNLSTALGSYQPAQERRLQGGFIAVTAVYGGARIPVTELEARLGREEEERRQLLNEKEREIVENHLLGDVSDHLAERIRSSNSRVADLNQLLRRTRTASGLYLSVDWKLDLPSGGDAGAVGYLLKRADLRTDYEKGVLRDFLLQRIRGAREQIEDTTWQERVLNGLDYRRWHQLTIWKHEAGKRQQLTDRTFGAKSGGEQAVMLHLPLFAAAAAYYDSCRRPCPRMVMLDEAFAGIDHEMRGRCMQFAVDFDLDMVMTSESELGTHPQVRQMAIYQLYRDPNVRGVYCERWVWNGRDLALDEQR